MLKSQFPNGNCEEHPAHKGNVSKMGKNTRRKIMSTNTPNMQQNCQKTNAKLDFDTPEF
jgi:hypothetical protein